LPSNRNNFFYVFLLTIAVFSACSTTGRTGVSQTGEGGDNISARGALGRMESGEAVMYSGDGGRNIRLAVLAPEVHGDVPDYLPLYIQGLLNNNIGRFSAISLIDRQNLDRIISEQNIAASGSFSDNDFVRIGNLTNAQYFLIGSIQRLSGSRFALQLSITDSSTGIRRASSMKEGSLAQLEGSGTLINEATAELLYMLGVQLTEAGRQTLLAGNTSAARAEAGLARGITAQAGGSEVEALFNFTQAITFDPSQVEALSRLSTLSSAISGGTISERIVNDIQARNRWLDVFKETAAFYNEHPPFEIIFDPNLLQVGNTDYQRNTANLGMRISLEASTAGFNALNALLEGLEKTGRRNVWGFSGWPLNDISPRVSGTVVFNGRRVFTYKVDVTLLNENNKVLGRSSITLTTGAIEFSPGYKVVNAPDAVMGVVNFPNVSAVDLTPGLIIVITAVNGIPTSELNASGYMRISTGDLEARYNRQEESTRRAQQETAQAQEAQKRQREARVRSAFDERADDANRNLFQFGFFPFLWQWSPGCLGFGLFDAGLYHSFVPFITTGATLKLGFFGISSDEDQEDGDTVAVIFSPIVGFVWPFNEYVKVFAEGALDMGLLGGYAGIFGDHMTLSYNLGIQFGFGNFDSGGFGEAGGVILQYRGSFYKGAYGHSVGIMMWLNLLDR